MVDHDISKPDELKKCFPRNIFWRLPVPHAVVMRTFPHNSIGNKICQHLLMHALAVGAISNLWQDRRESTTMSKRADDEAGLQEKGTDFRKERSDGRRRNRDQQSEPDGAIAVSKGANDEVADIAAQLSNTKQK